MKLSYLVLIALLVFVSCEKDEESTTPLSTIEFELQTFGDLNGGIFGQKHTLTRKNKEYQADDENGTYSTIKTYPNTDQEIIDIVGWGNDLHESVKQIYIRIPSNGVNTYTFDPETSDDKNFWLHLETTYSSELQGGYAGWGSPKTNLSVTITEITEDRIKGSFTGDLVYYNVEMKNGAKYMTIDEEITNINKPIINGTFDVFRSSY